jgi:hypothetical protein
VKTLNSFILLASLLATAPALHAVDTKGPADASVDRARRLAMPASAEEFHGALREITLVPGAPKASRKPLLNVSAPTSQRFDFTTESWIEESSASLIFTTNRAYHIALTDERIPIETRPVVAEAAGGFPGEVIEEVIVPVPSEIFMVMDKLGRPDWRGELRRGKTPTFSNRVDVALLLGSVVAEGFLAVQAEDQAAVERIGKDVLRLAESLGLKETVLPHTNSILEASKNNHWEIVRVELDKTQKTVRDTMEQRRDAELGQCVSLGGWLRGTDAVTSLIAKNYTSDAAELLNQPDIISHFQKELKKLATRNGKLKSLLDGLSVIAGVIGDGEEPPNAAGVKTIHETADRLVKSITTSASSAQ